MSFGALSAARRRDGEVLGKEMGRGARRGAHPPTARPQLRWLLAAYKPRLSCRCDSGLSLVAPRVGSRHKARRSSAGALLAVKYKPPPQGWFWVLFLLTRISS
jgi:hypothetical protein